MAKTKEQSKEVIKLTDLSLVELNQKAKLLKADLQTKILEKSVARLKSPRDIFNMRKQIARIKTQINIKSRLDSVKSDA